MKKFNFTPEEQEYYLSTKKPYTPRPRKPRKDVGEKRPKYICTLPKQYKSYIMRANKKSLSFDLTIEEFNTICNSNCNYCGELAQGVDRRNNLKGYTLDNSQPCCTQCNIMKFIYSDDKFMSKVNQIYNYHHHI